MVLNHKIIGMMSKKFTQTKLLIASKNLGKIEEIRRLLGNYNVQVLSAADIDVKEPEETEDSFKKNAELKAKYYGDASGLPALADDSGLCVEALNGDPGIYSARWAGKGGDFKKAMKRVEDELKKIEKESLKSEDNSGI